MSNQEVNSSTAVTPQNSVITSTTEEDNQSSADKDCLVESTSKSEKDDGDSSSVSNTDSQEVVRSESVIKSPFKPLFVSSSTTPVIKVVDSSHGECNSDSKPKSSSNLPQPFLFNRYTSHSSSQPNVFSSTTISASTNPFSRSSSSFSSSFISSSTLDNESSSSESNIVFEPSKLIPSSSSKSIFDSNLTRSSVLRTADGSSEDNSEPVSTIKTFVSLDKEDIGKINTPSFIKSSLNSMNGKASTSNKESDSQKDDSSDVTPSNTEYLFGQNLEDRVVLVSGTSLATDLKSEINSTSDTNLISFSDVTNSHSTLKSSENSNLDDMKQFEADTNASSSSSKPKDNVESLFKRKYEVITGEEDEQNVLSIFGKLYAWDTEKTSWVEKGRGHLRLNDTMKNDKLCSRLVMRTSGVLRVILNAHVVAGMKFELANDNCLRFTYVDGIYLIKANPKDIDQLHSAIEYRLRDLVKRARTENDTTATAADTENESTTESV